MHEKLLFVRRNVDESGEREKVLKPKHVGGLFKPPVHLFEILKQPPRLLEDVKQIVDRHSGELEIATSLFAAVSCISHKQLPC
mmetsp:Transcript_118007/g.235071  ORF Transcript_118007/g.235071 Transcript_118007/m.235071 type:complete len:83 (-) Transcript_118007:111-359(-)